MPLVFRDGISDRCPVENGCRSVAQFPKETIKIVKFRKSYVTTIITLAS